MEAAEAAEAAETSAAVEASHLRSGPSPERGGGRSRPDSPAGVGRARRKPLHSSSRLMSPVSAANRPLKAEPAVVVAPAIVVERRGHHPCQPLRRNTRAGQGSLSSHPPLFDGLRPRPAPSSAGAMPPTPATARASSTPRSAKMASAARPQTLGDGLRPHAPAPSSAGVRSPAPTHASAHASSTPRRTKASAAQPQTFCDGQPWYLLPQFRRLTSKAQAALLCRLDTRPETVPLPHECTARSLTAHEEKELCSRLYAPAHAQQHREASQRPSRMLDQDEVDSLLYRLMPRWGAWPRPTECPDALQPSRKLNQDEVDSLLYRLMPRWGAWPRPTEFPDSPLVSDKD